MTTFHVVGIIQAQGNGMHAHGHSLLLITIEINCNIIPVAILISRPIVRVDLSTLVLTGVSE